MKCQFNIARGIVEEHKFTRSHSGIFDVSHMGQLFIYGDERFNRRIRKNFSIRFKKFKTKHAQNIVF